jgi:hypothetical protein
LLMTLPQCPQYGRLIYLLPPDHVTKQHCFFRSREKNGRNNGQSQIFSNISNFWEPSHPLSFILEKKWQKKKAAEMKRLITLTHSNNPFIHFVIRCHTALFFLSFLLNHQFYAHLLCYVDMHYTILYILHFLCWYIAISSLIRVVLFETMTSSTLWSFELLLSDFDEGFGAWMPLLQVLI